MSSYSSLKSSPEIVVYATVADLPISPLPRSGKKAYVTETSRLYVSNGSGWYNIALINTNPTITTGGDATYVLAADGSATVVTLEANDPEGVPIAWSYAVTAGTLGGTVVTNTDNVFTITPSIDSADAGEFSLTFTASDGVNIATSASEFSLSFQRDYNPTLERTVADPSGINTNGFGVECALGDTALISRGYNANGRLYISEISTGNLLYTIDNPNPYGTASGDNFGINTRASGTKAVTSNYEEDGVEGTTVGRAYIVDLATGGLTSLVDPTPADQGNFGSQCDISGNYAIVGKRGYSAYTGRAYIYDATTAALVHTLVSPDGANDDFGQNVAIGGNYAAVSSKEAGGRVHIYDVTSGNLLHSITNTNGGNFGKLGLGTNSTYTFVSAWSDSLTAAAAGAIYMYNNSSGALVRTIQAPTPTTNGYFGAGMSCNEDYLVAGSGKVNALPPFTGIYDFNVPDAVSSWTEFPNTNSLSYFAQGLGMNDSYLALGAPDYPGGTAEQGRVYLYNLYP